MLPWKILKFASQIAGNMYFLFAFASSKFSRIAARLHEEGHFAQDFEMWGHVPPVPPVPTSMI